MSSEIGNKITYSGELSIDYDNGIITFTSQDTRILRVTHLPLPIGVTIDMVALPELTSYGPHIATR